MYTEYLGYILTLVTLAIGLSAYGALLAQRTNR